MLFERYRPSPPHLLTRKEFLKVAGATLFLAACEKKSHPPLPTPTVTQGRIGPIPETSTPTIIQVPPDQFTKEEQQLYQNGKTVDVLFPQNWKLLLDPTIGNSALLQYIGGIQQSVGVDSIFRITLQPPAIGEMPIHGLVPKDSQAGRILLPASQTLPNITAFEGQVVNVKILTFSDTDIYSDQGLALLCETCRIQ